MKSVLLITFTTFLLGGCASNPRHHDYTPEIFGGIIGGTIGSHFGKGSGRLIMTSIGTLTGVIVGQELSKVNQGTPQDGTILKEDLCRDYPTEGEIVSCERGVEERNLLIQRKEERNAYDRGRRGAWFS
jgi:uncharacterized protein YcfJ